MRAESRIALTCNSRHSLAHRRSNFKQFAVDPCSARHKNPSEAFRKKFQRLLYTAAAFKQTRARKQRISRSLAHARFNNRQENLVIRKAEHLLEHFGINRARRRCEQTIEQREPIAHRTIRQPPHREQHFFRDNNAFAFRNSTKMQRDLLRRNVAEIKSLAARLNRLRHLVRFRGAENELHMRRRLFHGLEQRVERGRREHVDFVDDVDAKLSTRWRESCTSDEIACVVDASVGSAVDFNHIEIFATENRIANGIAFGQRFVAIERASEDARHRSLAYAARATEEIGMRRSIGGDGILKRAGDRILADDLTEIARSVTACKDGVRLRGCHRGTWRGTWRDGVRGCCSLLRHRNSP